MASRTRSRLTRWVQPCAGFNLTQRLGVFAHLFKELRVRDAVLEAEQAQFAPAVPVLIRLCLAAAV